MLQVEGRFKNLDPFLFKLPGNGPENGIILADINLIPERESFQVGQNVSKNTCFGDGAEKDRLGDAFLLEVLDDLAELTEFHPEQTVCSLFKGGVGFPLMADHHHLSPLRLRCTDKKKRKLTATGDNSNPRVHRPLLSAQPRAWNP